MADWLAQFGLPKPLLRVADDHRVAWERLRDAAGAVVALPLRTAQQLLSPDGLPLAPDAETWAARCVELEQDLAEAKRAAAREADALRAAYGRLEMAQASQSGQVRLDQAEQVWVTLDPLLSQLPAVRQAVAAGREVAVADVLDLLDPLVQALAQLDLHAVGEVGAVSPFDPAQHQPTGALPESGAPVAIRVPGYRLGERLLKRARVSKVES